MAVTISTIHIYRVLDQVVTNLVQLQRDINRNAQAWLSQAQGQTIPLATLQAGITATIADYQRRLGWVQTLSQDATNYPKVQAVLQALGGLSSDIIDLYTSLNNTVTSASSADISTYAKIAAGANALINACQTPISLWPE